MTANCHTDVADDLQPSPENIVMDDEQRIGSRIATARKLRGLTQTQLADRAHVSASILRKVEQGQRPATSALVTSVAAALRVDRAELTGQPYRSGDRRQDAVYDTVPDLRRELIAYRLAPAEDGPVPTLDALRGAVAGLSAARHRVDLFDLGARLPAVLADLRAASWSCTGPDREQVMGLLAEAYYAARQFLSKLGYSDLAVLVTDRYAWAAEQSGDPLALALAGVLRALDLDAAADRRAARSVLESALGSWDSTDEDRASIQVGGFLHLMAGYLAAHVGDESGTWSHHAEAEALAIRLGRDEDAYRLAFGPTNVAIWGTALGVELMDGPKAVAKAARVHLSSDVQPERAGHHYIDLARAQLMNGDRPDALYSLLTARKIAPQQTRYHPLARDTVIALAKAGRRATTTVRSLATWMGIQD